MLLEDVEDGDFTVLDDLAELPWRLYLAGRGVKDTEIQMVMTYGSVKKMSADMRSMTEIMDISGYLWR